MWYGPGVRAGIAVTTAAGLGFVVGGLLLFRGVASADEPVVVAIDAETTGNSARVAGAIDDCVSVSVGERFEVDVVSPPPGVPSTRGISGYQFQFYYDLRVISVQDVNDNMLLTQAPGSNLVPFADVTPNTTGEYTRVAVDFGPAGIEPQGTSETGPGVIARLTLRAEAAGESPLGLRDVQLVEDGSAIYSNVEVRTGTVHVGSPCPAAQASVSPTPAPSTTPQTTPTPVAGAQGTVTVAPVHGDGGLAGGPEAGVGTLSPQGWRSPSSPVWVAMVAAGILGMAVARRLLTAPAACSTRRSLQDRRPKRAVLKRRGNKDC